MTEGHSGDRDVYEPPERPLVMTGATPWDRAMQPRPLALGVSSWLWLGACLLAVITAAAALFSFDQLHAEMLSIVEQQFPAESPGTRDQVTTAALAVLVGTGVLIALVQMVLALVLSSGRGWARPVLVLLAVLGALYGVSVFGVAPVVARAGLLVTGAVMLIAMVLMFAPGTRPWLGQQRLARSGGYGYDA